MKKNEWYEARVSPLSGFSSRRAKTVLDFALITQRQKGDIEAFLDIGCSDGTLTVLQQKTLKAKKSYGIDISPIALEVAKQKGIEVSILSLEDDKFPYSDEIFDVVFACDIIEHLFDSEKMLNEIYRVLKNNGVLILSTPNLASWYNRLSLFLGYQPFGTAASLHYPRAGKPFFTSPKNSWGISDWGGEHIRVMTLSALKNLLKFHSFTKIEAKGASVAVNNAKSFPLKIIGLVDRLFSFSPSASTWVVVKAIKETK